ncbi:MULTISPECIES: TetR/AcrR family transcriptional regulator [unclassified Variovorax]|uniref:TetR/AcrR family transcriptional regulator n=1 Tax=unclassified Variovorax TaxID=663243 RepID=UPI0016002DB1|nr:MULTISPECIES: TetR/AcrR family transcriptional regulator [unclassified Variovorax]MDM0089898.1 TetR/AcrR family transcriptional regulator [Variovorax sp. J22G40]MDM0148436.1 TetR/AcrR family transcriptional regulator [Variovorax sp. J2P1-31]
MAPTSKVKTPPKPPRWNNALAGTPDPREIRKRALIAAAGRTFGVKGFHNTTLDDIANALAVTKPALYRYVKNKHEILYECHRLAIGMAEEALAEAEAGQPAALEALRDFVERYIRKMTSELGTCVVLTEYYSMTAQHHALIQQRRRVVDTQLRALVTRCIDEGAIAPCDPKLAVFFFMGAINNINRWFTEKGETRGDAIAAAFADHVIHGLRPAAKGRRAKAGS